MSTPRVAVIAIHGVGDHPPFEMARSVSNLLEDLEDGPRKPRYTAFREDIVRLNVAPVSVKGHEFEAGCAPPNTVRPQSWGPMDDLVKSTRHPLQAATGDVESLDHLFMEGQLAGYRGEGAEDTYEMLRVSGERRPDAPVARAPGETPPAREVDIYDMFWSDLSGVGTAGLRIFSELYQVLFHLGLIGVNNVAAATASAEIRDTRAAPAWKRFEFAQFSAASLLALGLPLLNLILLAFTLSTVAVALLAKLAVGAATGVILFLTLAAATAAWGGRLLRKGSFSTVAFRWPLVVFLFLTLALVLAAHNFAPESRSQLLWSERVEWVAAVLLSVVALYAVNGIARSYEKRRPGAVAAFYLGLAFIAFLIAISVAGWKQSADFAAISLLLRLIEVTSWAIAIGWCCFFVLMAVAFVTGRLAVDRTIKEVPTEAARAARTNWTARITLALPAALFTLVTFAAWAGILQVTLPVLPQGARDTKTDCLVGSVRNTPESGLPNRMCHTPALPVSSSAEPAADWAWQRLFDVGAGYLPPLLLFVVLAGVIGIWGLAPSVLAEMHPPRGARADSALSAKALGDWLDHGFRFMREAGRVVYVGTLLFPLGIFASYFVPPDWLAWWRDIAGPSVRAAGVLVAGAGIGILGFGGRLSKLALGFRPIVRVALDVDNWLREHPRDSNPTARICGRYVSLLRHILEWKGPDGRGYDHLIVFAHSQGTVVTADLLRFLHAEAKSAGSYQAYDRTLARLDSMPVSLMTMGCPLRQLYGLRFPYLYSYACSADGPQPAELGVSEWVNVYRTGDYVGRYLWRPEPWEPVGTIECGSWNPTSGIPDKVWAHERRVEFCIGPGAHTHYFDSTAEAIAETLDVLIANVKPLQPPSDATSKPA
jgi:hypothetical protein